MILVWFQCLSNEIEDVVLIHPGVRKFCGGHTDKKSGEAVKLFVVKNTTTDGRKIIDLRKA